MTAIGRIRQFIEYKGITRYRFYKDTKVSNGYLDREGSVGSDIYERIIYCYPDVNVEWLITGEGDMLKNSVDSEYLLNSDKEFNTTVVLPISAWKVIQAQVESLSVRDRQIDELIKLLKSQMEENRKNDVRTDNATCADAG